MAMSSVPIGHENETTDAPSSLSTKSPDSVDKRVGARLRLQRTSANMSQEQLGEIVGVTFQQIQKYEKGANRIGAGRLQRIADALGVPISVFFDETAPQLLQTEMRQRSTRF